MISRPTVIKLAEGAHPDQHQAVLLCLQILTCLISSTTVVSLREVRCSPTLLSRFSDEIRSKSFCYDEQTLLSTRMMSESFFPTVCFLHVKQQSADHQKAYFATRRCLWSSEGFVGCQSVPLIVRDVHFPFSNQERVSLVIRGLH